MSETGISVERQVELISDVVHNHSNDINEFRENFNGLKTWTENCVEAVNSNYFKIAELTNRVENLEADAASGGVKKVFGYLALGVIGYLGFKWISSIEEKTEGANQKANCALNKVSKMVPKEENSGAI